MKLSNINSNHIKKAALQIDKEGIPKNYVWSQYYVVVNQKEYPFKYLTRTAFTLASDGDLKFQSNDSYRRYIEGLGFKFTYYEGGYNFFTKEELAFYVSIYGEDYRKDNPDQSHYGKRLYPINRKLKYWLEQILPEGYNIRYDGKWLGVNSKVSPYLWPRLFKGDDKDVFFNVEVAAYGQFLSFKLDGYYSTTKKLPAYKIELLDNFKNNPVNKWRWFKIPFSDLHAYDWNRLISESKDYLSEQVSNHDYLKKLFSKEKKISRITWNTNGWIKPSGRAGKSTNTSFELEHGFGHEEWLFDGNKIIGGYKYGFLEPIHKHKSKYEGKVYDLSLYTRESESKRSFWVTKLKDVEILTPEESEKILTFYKNEGWYEEMKSSLYNLNLDPSQLDLWVKNGAEHLFNVKFKASQLQEIPNEMVPILDENDIPSNRYTLLNSSVETEKKIEDEIKSGFSFDESGSEEADLETKSKRTGQKRDVELELKHNVLQAKFLKYLQKKYTKSSVKRECTAHGASRIDITRKTQSGYVFYEIKTYNNLKTSIREGIGQLLEYSLFPNVNEAEHIVLVSHVSPTLETKQYLNHLKKFISLPLSYIHFDIDLEEIILEI